MTGGLQIPSRRPQAEHPTMGTHFFPDHMTMASRSCPPAAGSEPLLSEPLLSLLGTLRSQDIPEESKGCGHCRRGVNTQINETVPPQEGEKDTGTHISQSERRLASSAYTEKRGLPSCPSWEQHQG